MMQCNNPASSFARRFAFDAIARCGQQKLYIP